MKTRKVIYFILMFLPLIISFIALQFLPERIPAHFGFDGQVDRYGSRFEVLLLPLVTVCMGYFLLAMSRIASRQEKYGANNEKMMVLIGIMVFILFNALNGYILYVSFHKIDNLRENPLGDIYRLTFGILGIIMAVIGNFMPKIKMNSIVGLRTLWSMKNEVTWKKSQLFGGISLIVGGILMVFINLFTKGAVCIVANIIIWTVLIPVDVLYTYMVARKY